MEDKKEPRSKNNRTNNDSNRYTIEKFLQATGANSPSQAFNVYLYGENHQESVYKNNLMIHAQFNEQVDYHLLVDMILILRLYMYFFV